MKILRLVRKNETASPGVMDELYGRLVSRKFRKRYTQHAVEAIINNYLTDPTNAKYAEEFKTMQAYRAECKKASRAEIEAGEKEATV